MDISKTFDRVWFAALLNKLPSYWSHIHEINAGVPQGSSHKPTSFLIHINFGHRTSASESPFLKTLSYISIHLLYIYNALHRNVFHATIFGCSRRGSVFEYKRVLFRIEVCFTITINKAQGQTPKVAGVNSRESCSSYGQLYMAYLIVSAQRSLVILV